MPETADAVEQPVEDASQSEASQVDTPAPEGAADQTTEPQAPPSPDDYEYTPPEGFEVDEALLGEVKKAAAALGLSQDQFKELADAYNRAAMQRAQELQRELNRDPDEVIAELRNEWGEATDQRLSELQSLAEAAFPDEVHDYLEASGLATNPAFIKGLWSMVEAARRGSRPVPKGPAAGMSREQAAAELDRMLKDGDWRAALLDPGHPKHQEALERRARLYEAAFGQPGSVLPFARAAARAAEPKLTLLTGEESATT